MKKTKITSEQKVFVEKFTTTGDMPQSVKTAYPNNKSIQSGQQTIAYGRRLLRSKVIKSAISKVLDKQGLSEKSLTKELYNLIYCGKKEDTKYKSIRLGYELHGSLEHEREETEDDAEIFAEIPAENQAEIIRKLVETINSKGVGT